MNRLMIPLSLRPYENQRKFLDTNWYAINANVREKISWLNCNSQHFGFYQYITFDIDNGEECDQPYLRRKFSSSY